MLPGMRLGVLLHMHKVCTRMRWVGLCSSSGPPSKTQSGKWRFGEVLYTWLVPASRAKAKGSGNEYCEWLIISLIFILPTYEKITTGVSR